MVRQLGAVVRVRIALCGLLLASFGPPTPAQEYLQDGLAWRDSVMNSLTVATTDLADLDGDGQPETISFVRAENPHEAAWSDTPDFTLAVNGITVSGDLPFAEGLVVVDLDTTDASREVAVFTHGPGSRDTYLLYSYDSSALREIGQVSGYPKFPGDGRIVATDWQDFWFRRKVYVVTVSGHIEQAYQKLYSVNAPATAKVTVPLYVDKGAEEVVWTLQPGDEVTVLLADIDGDPPEAWYLLKTGSGILGWVPYLATWDLEGLVHAN